MSDSSHRHFPTAKDLPWVEVGGVHFSRCKWCGEIIHKANGEPALQRKWHNGQNGEPNCLDAYLVRRSSRLLRAVVFKRDHGVCHECGRECAVQVGREQATIRMPGPRRDGRPTHRWYLRHSYRQVGAIYWQEVSGWEADHVVPLVDGGSFELENLVTRCASCHRVKTSQENSARATRRRQERQPELGLA